MKWWIRTIEYIIGCMLLVSGIFFINLKILHISYVPSESMEPTIQAHSLVIGTRYDTKKVKRNDVITFWQDGTILIKRVIGLPGETILIHQGKVFVNGKRLYYPYEKKTAIGEDVKINIPKDSLFVMGDNRNNSTDSRVFGPIKKKEIIGRSKIILLPVPRKIQ